MVRIVSTGLLALALMVPAFAGGLNVGDKVPAFTFKDIRYVTRSLDDFKEAKVIVLMTATNGCPVAQKYLAKLAELDVEYGPKGVQFAVLNTGPSDTITEIAKVGIDFNLKYPLLKDLDGEAAAALGAERTAEVFVIGADRVLRYHGRVDDQYRVSGVQPNVTRHDLKEAIDAVLAGKDVEVATTPVDGCAIEKQTASAGGDKYSFAKDVAPILYNNCVECHRENGGAPFSLIEYKDASNYANMIAEVVKEERMPPWFAHREFGTWENARGLSDEDKAVVIGWAKGGKARGGMAALPAVPEFPKDTWQNGEPDIILSAAKEESLPASGFLEYRYAALPHEFKEDVWVQGIEIMPANKAVVHHCNLFYRDPKGEIGFLTGRVPGGNPIDLNHGQAMMIPKGVTLMVQIHYVTTGKEEKDRISVGFRYAKEKVTKRVYNGIAQNRGFEITPGDSSHAVEAEVTFDEDSTGTGLFSHMHYRGKDMTFTATYPDGKSETLLVIPNYSFDWQIGYKWAPDTKKFPAGTKLKVVAHFDNSTFNSFNPDPANAVKWGDQTVDEMMQGFYFFTKDAETLDLAINPETGEAMGVQTASAGE